MRPAPNGSIGVVMESDDDDVDEFLVCGGAGEHSEPHGRRGYDPAPPASGRP
ncbi:hypothetical protein FH972_010156 [Carpinus fangiana]|uniref:Uncharacterized protein n=1 Tax=Carpinus fangiana TaxID=176857 RepID=A0A660KME0_9ROSI|nr:hypothetical protein FH972_010156 [Carpinus fangiana]